jgi:NAD(P)-dependent dehydrogenase (short-subunit alcohol dehydrogenase family)
MRAIYPSLKDKRVVVTGGATGIGAGLVEAFVAQGARVAFIDINENAGLALKERLTPSPIFRTLDLCDLDAIGATFTALEAELGGIEVLINNAARDDRDSIEKVTPAFWDKQIATNLRHVFFAAQAVIPGMRRRKSGVIINFSSISWHVGLTDLLVYQTAKAGIEGMTRALARELGADGIRVNTIVPGHVDTPRQKQWHTPKTEAQIVANQSLKSLIQPADIAALALFLASDDARMCTGQEYWVAGGWL